MRKLFILSMMITLLSCSKNDQNVYTYWVNSYKVLCDDTGNMQCLLVQRADIIQPGQWITFYSPIEGFDYEPGYIYKLKVKEEPVEKPAADASSIQYKLVKILDKKKDLNLKINNVWEASVVNGTAIIGGNLPTMEIQLASSKVFGDDGCNRFSGSITLFDDGVIEFGPIASTRMMCPDMDVSDQFNSALLKVKKYKLKDDTLTFQDDSGNDLIILNKAD